MAILLPAEGSVRPISFSVQAHGLIKGGYAWNPDGPSEFAIAEALTGFSHSPNGLPAEPFQAHVEGSLPDLPEARWFASGAPSLDFRFDVPVWSHPPALDGNWKSCEIRLTGTLAGANGADMGCFVQPQFEFETTEAIEIQYSGWEYYNLTQDQFSNPPLDHLGRLMPGRHLLKALPTGNLPLPNSTANFLLILGPVPPDTDGDQVSDYDETTTHHTNPNQADTDSDGLSDSAEIRTLGTNPLLVDTDGDGFKDQFEHDSGKNPVDPNQAPATAITLKPAAVTPGPALELRILTKLGVRYQLQSTSTLQDWTDQGAPKEGTGDEVSVIQPIEAGAKFWRLTEVANQ